jgi:hypothetical protein
VQGRYAAKVLSLENEPGLKHIIEVYGPSSGPDRGDFFQQIKEEKSEEGMPWTVCGDFNLVLRSEERTSQILWPRDRAFRSLINDLALIDLPLSDRKYTWVNNIRKARLDRFLISQD